MKVMLYMIFHTIILPPLLFGLGFGIGYATAAVRGWYKKYKNKKKASGNA